MERLKGRVLLLLFFSNVWWSDHSWGVIGDEPSMSRKEQAGKREGRKMSFKHFRGLPWGRRIALFCGLPGLVSRSSQSSGFCSAPGGVAALGW